MSFELPLVKMTLPAYLELSRKELCLSGSFKG